MDILIFALILILIVGLAIYAIDLLPGVDSRLANLLKLLVIVIAVVVLASRVL
jgi:hypothetical protein